MINSKNVNKPSIEITLYDDTLFQDGISGWLCEEMSGEGLSLDQMDVSGISFVFLSRIWQLEIHI